ncbi:MAG TPA: glycoside hydrolase family 15 protein [Candidatus Dormibacteraeota bacterium]
MSTEGQGQSVPEWPIRDYFCVGDGSSAVLLDPQAGCHFWCWPGFDGQLRLAALLDPAGGGSVGLSPASRPLSGAGWLESSRVVSYQGQPGLRIQAGLLPDGAQGSAVVWIVDGPPGAEVLISLVDPTAGGGQGWSATRGGAELGPALLPDGPGGPLFLASSLPVEVAPGGLLPRLGPEGLVVWLGGGDRARRPPPLLARAVRSPVACARETRRMLAAAVAEDRSWLQGLHRAAPLVGFRQSAPPWALAALDRSLLTLRGLQERNSGLLVASPTTSIPQSPGSERAWDYRYAWLRDCADAGIALAHVGALSEARAVASGVGRILGEDPDLAAPVRRLNGAALPPEHVVAQLQGYSGAPVRIGNDAASQVQLDTLGEVARLAGELASAGECPDDLLRLVPTLADSASRRWPLPDHGIWEVRNLPQDYVHSKVMAWTAMRVATRLAEAGWISGPGRRWSQEVGAVEEAIDARGRGPGGGLAMSFQDPSADSALLAAYVVSFIDPNRAQASATLDNVLENLAVGPLLARHRPERDTIPAPCLPFIFPALWAAVAEARLGRRRAAITRVEAICKLAGAAGQLSEVADPASGSLWATIPRCRATPH